VIQNKGKYGKILYSHQGRLFETYQLRLMIDAILSARFITTNEKKNLIEKIKQLTSKRNAKTFPRPIMQSQAGTMDYEHVELDIDRVHAAMVETNVLTYQYGEFNVDKQFVYSRDGAYYHVEPYALMRQNGYYNLSGHLQKTNEMRHCRLDRTRNIKV